MKRITPTLWLSFGLTAFTLSVTLLAYTVGLIPDGHKLALDSRAKVAESLAIQLVSAVNRNDAEGLEEVLNSVVQRNEDVLSGAVRYADGTIVFEAGSHSKNWVAPPDGKSTTTHVTVPLMGSSGQQGSIELAFAEPEAMQRILGIPTSILIFLAFLTGLGFVGYFILLRRTLRQLDPGRVIPERVQKAFDTLSEGVIIVDEKQRMLLINKSFFRTCGDRQKLEIGAKINSLSWRMVDGSAKAGGFPWYSAIKLGQEVNRDLLSLRTADGQIVNFNVSATVIANEKGRTIGAIITLSDLTQSKRIEDEYNSTIDKLERVEEEVLHYRQELEYAKSHDALTGCLNRQSFVLELERSMNSPANPNRVISTICFKIDQLSEVNKSHGIALADKLLAALIETLEAVLEDGDFVGRLNAGTFCIALADKGAKQAQQMVRTVQQVFDSERAKYLSGQQKVTLSFGLSKTDQLNSSAHALMNRTLLALDNAKEATSEKNGERSQEAVNHAASRSSGMVATHQSASNSAMIGQMPTKQGGLGTLAADSAVEMKYFLDSVDHALDLAKDKDGQLAVVQISIDSWEYLSEAITISGVEGLLAEVTRRCASAVRASDHLVSIHNSGDILIRLSEFELVSQIEHVIEQIMSQLDKPIAVNDQQIHVTANAGMSLFPQDGSTSTILLRNAGIAMRRAKDEALAKRYRFYSVDMIQGSQERLLIESGIRVALQKDEFQLHFQPIINAKTAIISAAECLLRCNSLRLKGFRIDQIVDVAEMSTLSLEIDKWVLKTALAQLARWDEAGIFLPKISINVSAHQLTNITFMDHVYASIAAAPVEPHRIQIEVTETARIAGVEIAAKQVKRLQQLGVVIALDDFGTGQASLSYLQRLHPDIIKIDRSFVDGVHTNHANATLVSATTVMAHSLGLKVVAEGVEQDGELEFLCNIGCDEIQGYLFAKPMPEQMMADWIKNSNLRARSRQQDVDESHIDHLEPVQQQDAIAS